MTRKTIVVLFSLLLAAAPAFAATTAKKPNVVKRVVKHTLRVLSAPFKGGPADRDNIYT